MNAALQPVDAGDLFVYPVPSRERLETHYFVQFHYRRWFLSDFRNTSDLDVRAIGLELFFLSQDLAPVGTLPTDEALIAKLVDLSLEQWTSLAKREVTPLHNWRKCICDDGVVRLYHPVVLEMVNAALGSRLAAEARRETDRERKRIKALEAQMIRASIPLDFAENEMLRVQIDQWLLDNFPDRQRRPAMVREAYEAVMRGRARP